MYTKKKYSVLPQRKNKFQFRYMLIECDYLHLEQHLLLEFRKVSASMQISTEFFCLILFPLLDCRQF